MKELSNAGIKKNLSPLLSEITITFSEIEQSIFIMESLFLKSLNFPFQRISEKINEIIAKIDNFLILKRFIRKDLEYFTQYLLGDRQRIQNIASELIALKQTDSTLNLSDSETASYTALICLILIIFYLEAIETELNSQNIRKSRAIYRKLCSLVKQFHAELEENNK